MGTGRALTKRNTYKKQATKNPNFARKVKNFDNPYKQKKDGDDPADHQPRFRDKRESKPKQESLQLITVPEEELIRKDIPFVIPTLPQSVEDLEKIIMQHVTEGKKLNKAKTWTQKPDRLTKMQVLLRRLRDYHDPLGIQLENVTPAEQKKAMSKAQKKYNNFIGALVDLWYSGGTPQSVAEVEQQPSFQLILAQTIKEMISESATYIENRRIQQITAANSQNQLETHSSYVVNMTREMSMAVIMYIEGFNLGTFVKEAAGSEEGQAQLEEVLATTSKCLSIFLQLLSAPQCKLLNILDKMCSLLYTDIADASLNILLAHSNPGPILQLINVIHLHLGILQEQSKPLSPSVNFILGKMIDGIRCCSIQELQEQLAMAIYPQINMHFSTLNKKVPNVQVHTDHLQQKLMELSKSAGKAGKLLAGLAAAQHMEEQTRQLHVLDSLRKEVPKALATYYPKIEDDFLLKSKKKGPMDDRTLRKKTMQAEKAAIKEFKRDNSVLQRQKQMEIKERRSLAKRQTYRIGTSLKDEI